MGLYDRQIATALRTITKKGRLCVWAELSDTAPADPNKPWKKDGAVSTPHSVRIVFLPSSRDNLAFLQALTDVPIVAGSDYGLMAATDFVPTTRANIFAEDGTTLLRGVKSLDTLAPNGDAILHTVRFTVAS